MTTRGQRIRANGLEFSALRAGPAGGETVLCLHGFPDSPRTFNGVVPRLAEAGYDVVAPYLRGYEPSSQPRSGNYDLTALAADVVGWLDDLGIERAHLVGHDWGAAIAYVTASQYPDRLASMTAMAVPPLARIPVAVRRVPRQLLLSWYMTWFQVPWLAERSLRAGNWWLMRRLRHAWSPGHELGTEDWADLRATFSQPGVVTAALAYYRQNATPPILLGLRQPPAMAYPTIGVRSLIINGTDDGCMAPDLFGAAILEPDFTAGVVHCELPGVGHFANLEQPERVADLLMRHFRGDNGASPAP